MEKIRKYKFSFMDLWLLFSTVLMIYCLVVLLINTRAVNIYPDKFSGEIYTKSGMLYGTYNSDDAFVREGKYYILDSSYDFEDSDGNKVHREFQTKILISEIEGIKVYNDTVKVGETSGGN